MHRRRARARVDYNADYYTALIKKKTRTGLEIHKFMSNSESRQKIRKITVLILFGASVK